MGLSRSSKYSSDVLSQLVSQWLLSENKRTRLASPGIPSRWRSSLSLSERCSTPAPGELATSAVDFSSSIRDRSPRVGRRLDDSVASATGPVDLSRLLGWLLWRLHGNPGGPAGCDLALARGLRGLGTMSS